MILLHTQVPTAAFKGGIARLTAMCCLAFLMGCIEQHVMVPYMMRGGHHPTPHTGVDFGGDLGDPILAAADGTVIRVDDTPGGGLCVLLKHSSCAACTPSPFYTIYCHMLKAAVHDGEIVLRGQQIGEMGHSGTGSFGITHVHFELCTVPCTGALAGTLDPMQFDVGCFDPHREYVTHERPLLTHPIACTGR
jgi:hypothetical protein